MDFIDQINKSAVARQVDAYRELHDSRDASRLSAVMQLVLSASSELYEERISRRGSATLESASDIANRMAQLVIRGAIVQQNPEDSGEEEEEGEGGGGGARGNDQQQPIILSSDAAVDFAQLLYDRVHSGSGYGSVSKIDVPHRCTQGLVGNIVYTRGVSFLLKRSGMGEELEWGVGKGVVKGRQGVRVIMSSDEGVAVMQSRATSTTMSALIGQNAKDAGPVTSKWWNSNSLPLGGVFPAAPTPVSVDVAMRDPDSESKLVYRIGRGFTVDDGVSVPYYARPLGRLTTGVDGIFSDAFRIFMVTSCMDTSIRLIMNATHTDPADASIAYNSYAENGWLSPLLGVYSQDNPSKPDEYRVISRDVPLSFEEVLGEIGVCFERTISVLMEVAQGDPYDVRMMLRDWKNTFSELSLESRDYGLAMEMARQQVAYAWTGTRIRKRLVTAIFDTWNNSLEEPMTRSWFKQLCNWLASDDTCLSPHRNLPIHGLQWVIDSGVTTLAMSDAMVYLFAEGRWGIEDEITSAICAALQSQRLMRCKAIFEKLAMSAWVSRVAATVPGSDVPGDGEIESNTPIRVPIYTPAVMRALETNWHLHTRGRELLYDRISSEAATYIPFQDTGRTTLRLNVASSRVSDFGASLTVRWVFVLPRDVCKWNITVGYSGIPGVDGVTEKFTDWGFYTEGVNIIDPPPSNTHTELLVDVTFAIASRDTGQVGHDSHLTFRGSCSFTSSARSIEFEDESTTNIVFTPTNQDNRNYVLEVDRILCTPRTVVVGPNV